MVTFINYIYYKLINHTLLIKIILKDFYDYNKLYDSYLTQLRFVGIRKVVF